MFGRAELTLPMRVVMVSTVVTPSPTRAGAAPLLSQKETQDITTIRLDGTYTYNEKIKMVHKNKVEHGVCLLFRS